MLQTILIDKPQNKSEVLNITVVQAEEIDNLVEAEFDWIATNITSDSIQIKLVFADPVLISSGGSVKHSVQVSLSDDQRLFLVSKTGRLISPDDKILLSEIPQQNVVSEGMSQAIETAQNLLKIAFSSRSFVSILIGGSLQSILGEVKILQYLVYPMGFNMLPPINLL